MLALCASASVSLPGGPELTPGGLRSNADGLQRAISADAGVRHGYFGRQTRTETRLLTANPDIPEFPGRTATVALTCVVRAILNTSAYEASSKIARPATTGR
jgi:hypothetical protein